MVILIILGVVVIMAFVISSAKKKKEQQARDLERQRQAETERRFMEKISANENVNRIVGEISNYLSNVIENNKHRGCEFQIRIYLKDLQFGIALQEKYLNSIKQFIHMDGYKSLAIYHFAEEGLPDLSNTFEVTRFGMTCADKIATNLSEKGINVSVKHLVGIIDSEDYRREEEGTVCAIVYKPQNTNTW